MDLLRLLGANVRAARRRKGVTQEALALDAGMKRSYLSDLERGTRSPSVRAVERLAVALDLEAWELLAPPDR